MRKEWKFVSYVKSRISGAFSLRFCHRWIYNTFFLVGFLVLVFPVQRDLRQMLRMLQASCMTQLGAVLALQAH